MTLAPKRTRQPVERLTTSIFDEMEDESAFEFGIVIVKRTERIVRLLDEGEQFAAICPRRGTHFERTQPRSQTRNPSRQATLKTGTHRPLARAQASEGPHEPLKTWRPWALNDVTKEDIADTNRLPKNDGEQLIGDGGVIIGGGGIVEVAHARVDKSHFGARSATAVRREKRMERIDTPDLRVVTRQGLTVNRRQPREEELNFRKRR